jgi:hypothetical protein
MSSNLGSCPMARFGKRNLQKVFTLFSGGHWRKPLRVGNTVTGYVT